MFSPRNGISCDPSNCAVTRTGAYPSGLLVDVARLRGLFQNGIQVERAAIQATIVKGAKDAIRRDACPLSVIVFELFDVTGKVCRYTDDAGGFMPQKDLIAACIEDAIHLEEATNFPSRLLDQNKYAGASVRSSCV